MGALIRGFLAKNKRQKLTILAVGFIVYVLALSGIFSYFHGSDAVTNRISAAQGSVTIQEPNWDSTGQYKARASEPGMKIEKDPSGYNNGQVDLYIRLKMTIDVSRYDDSDKTDDYKTNFANNTDRRIKSILQAIMLEGDPAHAFLTWDADNSKWVCHNDKFFYDTNNYGTNEKPEYYFYYTGENADTMKIVKPNESTKELFDHIDIPIYKKDYLGVFDQNYDIILTAEGIPAANFPNGLTVETAKGNDSPFKA